MAEISKELINEINRLAHKSKTEGLTDEEKIKQQKLRKEYITAFKSGFKAQLQTIKVVDANGNDITPKKLKDEKKKKMTH